MKLFIENIAINPNVTIGQDSDPTPAGFTDETMDLLKWRDYGLQGTTDCMQFREAVTDVVEAKGQLPTPILWADFTNDEKDFLIEAYIRETGVTSADDGTRKVTHLMTVHGMSLDDAKAKLQDVWAVYHQKEIASSKTRASSKTIFRILAKYLSLADAADFTNVIEHPYYMYTTQAIRGTNDGETGVGLFDFIESTPGTIYETAGLAQQGYTMANGDPDMTNFISELMDVLRHGNYEA